MKRRGKVLTAEKISNSSFILRLKYKIYDIVKPTIDPRIALFSKLEKQLLFFVILSVVVFTSVYLVIEFGY